MIKGVNVYAVAPYSGSGLDDQFTWFANASNVRNFARHLKTWHFNMVRLPVMNDLTTTYLDAVKAFGDALWEHGIATLVCPFDGTTFLTNGPGNFDTTGALNCGYWLSYAWDYMGQPAWFLFDTFNEPNQFAGTPGDLTDAQWESGMQTLITEARKSGYAGPIFVEGNGWSWSYPTTAGSAFSDMKTFDTQIVAQGHRYATADGTGAAATDGADSYTWKTEWADQSAADGIAMVIGEWGPYNGGYGNGGSDNFANNVTRWCDPMARMVELMCKRGHCAGSFAWTWVWLDETTDPGNSMVTYTDTDWNNFVAGNNIPAVNLWGEIVYGMFEEPWTTLRRIRELHRDRDVGGAAVSSATRLRVVLRTQASATHAVSPATRLRTVERQRASAVHAVTPSTRLRVAERQRASASHAVTGSSRLRTPVQARAGATTDRSPVTRLRVAARSSAVADAAHETAVRLRTAIRSSSTATHAVTTASRLRGVVQARAAATPARETATLAHTVIRARAAATPARATASRLEAVVRGRAGAGTDRPSGARLRTAIRDRAAASTERTASTRLLATIRVRVASAAAGAVFTATRLYVNLRIRAAATSERTAAVREPVAVETTAAATSAREAATRQRITVRSATAATKAAAATTRLRADVRGRASATTARTASARLGASVRLRAGSSASRVAGTVLRLVARLRAAFTTTPPPPIPREPFSSTAVQTGERGSARVRSGAHSSTALVGGTRSSERQ